MCRMKLMKKLRSNIIANYIGKGWSIVAVYICAPLHLHFLGLETYGLIGFYTILISLLALVDMGLTAALNRKIAILSETESGEKEIRHHRVILSGQDIYLAA